MTFIEKAVKEYFHLVHKILRKKKFDTFLSVSVVFSCLTLCIGFYQVISLQKNSTEVLGAKIAEAQTVLVTPVVQITVGPVTQSPSTPTPTKKPTPTPTREPKKPTNTAVPNTSNSQQYTAEKIGDTTFKVKNVPLDSSMASAQDIVNALNSYRGSHGKSNLEVDNNLSAFAEARANKFSSNNELDSHQGFQDYMNNGGFEKSGFNALGENSAYLSGPMNGEKIIKSIFGADSLHDGNQLADWTHVGIGVSGNAINVNFGKNKR